MGTTLVWPPTSWATPMLASHYLVRQSLELGNERGKGPYRGRGLGKEDSERKAEENQKIVRQGLVRRGRERNGMRGG